MAEPFVKNLTWASGIGADGRPKLLPPYENSVEGTQTCPAVSGAANWPSSAFSPATGLFYVMASEACAVYRKNSDWFELGKVVLWRNDEARDDRRRRKISESARSAIGKAGVGSAKDRRRRDRIRALMSTAGGLVFYGDNTGGALVAVDARTGQRLWQFETQQTWKSSPMTYAIDGKAIHRRGRRVDSQSVRIAELGRPFSISRETKRIELDVRVQELNLIRALRRFG